MPRSPRHQAALNYALAGIPVFPCISDEMGRPLPWSQKKKPVVNGGFKAATTDLEQINKWWAKGDWNIGVCPEDCGWAVIDFEADADPTYMAKFPATYTIQTPRGGWHYYYEGSLAMSVAKLAPRVDTRGIGSYVLVPPSIVNGKPYKLLKNGGCAPLPDWVIIPKAKPVANGHDHESDLPANVARAIKYLADLPEVREKEGADARTYEAACKLKDLGLSADKTFEVMLEHYRCRPRDGRFNGFLQAKVAHAFEYGTNPPGVNAAPSTATLARIPAVQELIQAENKSRLVSVSAAHVQMLKTDWLWPQRFPLAMCSLVAGHTKLGKTTVLLDIAARVTTGANWSDGGKAPMGSVIYFSGEDDIERTLVPRFVACGGDRNRFHIVRATRDEDGMLRTFSLMADLEELAKLMTAIGDVRLVIFDPISSYFGKTDTFRNAEVRSVLEPLVRFASQHNITVIGNTHLGKANKGPANLRVLDSVAFTATVRSIYMVAKDKDDPKRRLFVPAGGNLSKDMDGLAFTINAKFVMEGITGTFVQWDATAVTDTADDIYADNDKQDKDRSKQLTEASNWLREFLADGPKHSAEVWTAAEAAGLALSTVRRAIKRLGVVSDKEKGSMSAGWIMSLPRS